MVRDKVLMEKYKKITESKSAKPMSEKSKAIFERLLHNQLGYLAESQGTFSGDMAILGQILIPVYRRAFAQMVGKYLAGTQPMKESTGYAFALRYHFVGNSAGNGANGVLGGGNTQFPTTSYNFTPQDKNRNAPNSAILYWSSTAARQADAPDVGYGDAPVAGTGNLSGLVTIIFTEDNKAVVRLAGATTLAQLKALAGATGSTITNYYDNEAGYLHLLQTYPGPLSTLVGEKLGADMQEIGLTIDKIAVVAQTRKLKARWTLEAAQDLKASHGKDMASEMIDILTYEITQSIDRQILSTINSQAVATNFNVSTDSDGRWQLERFRALYTEIVRKSNDIARTTLRGPGNNIVATPDVITALEQIPTFIGISPIAGDINSGEPVNSTGSSRVGTLGGRFNLYRDVFNGIDGVGNYATILYKGASEYDAPVIWSPYVPLEMKQLVDPETGNPSILFYERSAITANIFGSDHYSRKISISNLF